MKLKSKLLLCATSLLTVSVAATATSAFAWFTAGSRASYTQLTGSTIKTNTSDLSVVVKAKVAGTGDTNDADTDTTITDSTSTTIAVTTPKAYDVSGNGKDFYKAVYNKDSQISSYQKVYNGLNNVVYYQQFKLSFKTSNQNMVIALGEGMGAKGAINDDTTIQSKNNNAAKCARIAFLNSEATKVLCYYAPNDEASTCTYVGGLTLEDDNKKIATTIGDASTYEDYNVMSGAVTDVTEANYVAATTGAEGTIKNGTASKGVLGTATTADPLDVVVRIWIEGDDADCVSYDNIETEDVTEGALGGVFDTTFDFNGLVVE